MAESAIPQTDISPCRPKPRRALPAVWQVWLAFVAILVVVIIVTDWPLMMQDPDDYMRLLQVRDWLGGQAFYDTRQYRLDPPHGADMHWIRLVDLPLAFFMLLFGTVLPAAKAEAVTLALVPLGQLLLALYLLRAIVRQLGGGKAEQFAATVIVPLFPLLMTNFLPARIDHHGWQALAALTVAWAMLRNSWRHAALAGLVTAAWLMISLEGMALAAVFGGLFALRYVLFGDRQHEAFLGALALGIAVLFAIFRPVSEVFTALCDLPAWPHILAFGGGAVVAAGARLLPGQGQPLGRLASLVPVAGVAAAGLFVPLGWCVVSPLDLDPFLKTNWFDNMSESANITRQSASVAGMTLWTLLLAVAGSWTMLARSQNKEQWQARAFYGVALVGACGVSLLIMRAGLSAQLLCVPVSAFLIVRFWGRVRALEPMVPRIVATLGLLLLATPTFVSAALKPLDRANVHTQVQLPAGLAEESCDYSTLNALPRSMLFATLDRGPEILARTPHSAVMSGYHRNQQKMRETILGFAGPLPEAEAIIRANHADYVVACLTSGDLAIAAGAGENNLADAIYAGTHPDWLMPVPGFEQGPLRVYKVR